MFTNAQIFEARVPRYTSYPTAPHFHRGIDAKIYEGWLRELPAELPLSLYLHIPFCDTLCWFCGCHTTAVNNYAPVHAYCDHLLAEIEAVAARLGRRHPVKHIHWGGGSPTMLSAEDVGRLSSAIRRHFEVLPDAEFAIEIDPRGFTRAQAEMFAQAGLTRASIGLQDSNPEVQRAINRLQSEEETFAAVEALRAAGVSRINIDLVYGLPKQTLESWEDTLDFALSLDPDRLAVFGYAHVPKFKKHQALIPERLLPDLEGRLAMAELARQIFCEHGYVAIGLDHFAKPQDGLAVAARNGTLARNFQGYTTDTAPALIGLGASSISALPQGYAQNVPAVPDYRRMLEEGRLPVARGIALSDDDRMRRAVIERLMCDLTVDLAAIAARYGRPVRDFDDALARLTELREAGAVTLADGRLTVTPEWRVAVRMVCAAFDVYLNAGETRHSLAV